LTQAFEIRAAAALRVQPTRRAQRLVQIAEQCVVVQHPVERRGTEDSVEASAKRKSDEISRDKPNTVAKIRRKILLRVHQHIAGYVEANDAATRKILQEKAS
jgi:hypothetical protein